MDYQMSLDDLIRRALRFSAVDRARIIERLAESLQSDKAPDEDWHEMLRATYGILTDDPIERPPPLPLEERDPIE